MSARSACNDAATSFELFEQNRRVLTTFSFKLARSPPSNQSIVFSFNRPLRFVNFPNVKLLVGSLLCSLVLSFDSQSTLIYIFLTGKEIKL